MKTIPRFDINQLYNSGLYDKYPAKMPTQKMSVFRTKCTSHTAAKFHWQHSLLTLHTGFYNSRNLLTLPQP